MNRFAYLLAGSQRKHTRWQCKHFKHFADPSEKRGVDFEHILFEANSEESEIISAK